MSCTENDQSAVEPHPGQNKAKHKRNFVGREGWLWGFTREAHTTEPFSPRPRERA